MFEYIAAYALQTNVSDEQQLVMTCRDGVITNPESTFISERVSPCVHEEADTRMLMHVEEILKSESSVTLRTVDTDVLVLAVAAAARHNDNKIWVYFGVRDRKKVLSVHQMKDAIVDEKAADLPTFHAFTGCDTVSSFKSVGKKTTWQRWKFFNDVTKVFIDLSNGPSEMDPETQQLLERFTILLPVYQRERIEGRTLHPRKIDFKNSTNRWSSPSTWTA